MAYLCPICGAELREEHTRAVCSFCAEETAVEWRCPNGHAVCEACQLADLPEMIRRVCAGSHETDPASITNRMMRHPLVTEHGPQHHLLVAPAVLTALANSGQRPLKPGQLGAAIRRSSRVPYGACGTRGECGAAVSAGALVALVSGATYRRDRERSLALQATADSLAAIARAGGPRCCKQSVYLALEASVSLLSRELGLAVPLTIRCEFAARNPECKQERCPYYVG